MSDILSVLAAIGQIIQGLAAPFSVYFAYRAIIELGRQKKRDSASECAIEIYSAIFRCALVINRARLPGEINLAASDEDSFEYFTLPGREIERSLSDFDELQRLAPIAEVFFGTKAKAAILAIFELGMSVLRGSQKLAMTVRDNTTNDDDIIELKRIVFYAPSDSTEVQLNEALSVVIKELKLTTFRADKV